MATIPTPEQGKPILDFSEGIFDGSSYLFQSRNGATEHISGDDVADYVNTSRVYNTLDTESKTPVGAINEINAKDASDITYDNTASGMSATDVQAAIDEINSIAAPLFYAKTYTYTAESIDAGAALNISRENFGIVDINGYTAFAVSRIGVSDSRLAINTFNSLGVSIVLSVKNTTTAAITNTTFTIRLIFVKSNFLKSLT